MKRSYIFLLLFFALLSQSRASYWLGGEIYWDCLGSGEFQFSVVVYRDCTLPLSAPNLTIDVWNHPTVPNIPLALVSQTNISPSCTPVGGGPPAISCAGANPGSVEKYMLQSAPIFLSGTPPVGGWIFSWDDAFRSPGVDNLILSGSAGITLHAVMYQLSAGNTNPCYDSSPRFAQEAISSFCSGHNMLLNYDAHDPDGDSLSFKWAVPYGQLVGAWNPPLDPVPVAWNAGSGFSTTSQLPGPGINPANIPAVLDAKTGKLTFKSTSIGEYTLVIKVESWRCGTKISEIYREVQTNITLCTGNNPPVILPPFALGTSYERTITAGDFVSFTFNSSDTETLQNGAQQSNTLRPSGLMFGTGFSSSVAGCPFPPCATLNNPMPLTAQNGISTLFEWQTDCAHVFANGCGGSSVTYNFVFNVSDDYCAVPGVVAPTVSITVVSPLVDSPSLRCLEVLANGDVNLSWQKPVDTYGTFNQYEIYASAAQSGPYALVGVEPTLNNTSFLHAGAGANFSQRYYFVRTRSGCSANFLSLPSDTLSTMHLTVTKPNAGVAQLNWNPISAPLNTPTSTNFYFIYREFPTGVWTFIGSTPYRTEQFRDTVTICGQTINYKVEILDMSGCRSVSSLDGDFFSDSFGPDIPEVLYLTVDINTNTTYIYWKPSSAGDTWGYVVSDVRPNGDFQHYDTVPGINSNSSLISNANPASGPVPFFVFAVDSCDNYSGIGNSHQTVFLEAELDVCAKTISLNWSPYKGWPYGVSKYQLFVSRDGVPYQSLGTFAPGDYSFIHEEVQPLSTYCYYVAASAGGLPYISNSNRLCIFMSKPPEPAFNYLSAVTVTDDQKIEIVQHVDVNATISHYRLERALPPGTVFVEIGKLIPDGSPFIKFIDDQVDPKMRQYFYRTTVVNTCMEDRLRSNISRNINLKVREDYSAITNVLSWTDYGTWDANITGYEIYRSLEACGNFEYRGTAPPNLLSFEDDVAPHIDGNGRFCYRVKALEGANTFGFMATSNSNDIVAHQETQMWVPNAFIYGGINNIFKPVRAFADVSEYYLRIFNRWGQEVHESRAYEEGWDGTFRGSLVQEGVYVYSINYLDSEGFPHIISGTVTFLKAN